MKYLGTVMAKVEGTSNAAPTVLTVDNSVKHGLGVTVNKDEGTVYEGEYRMGQ